MHVHIGRKFTLLWRLTYWIQNTNYRCCRLVFNGISLCPFGVIVSQCHDVFVPSWSYSRGPTKSIPTWVQASSLTCMGWSTACSFLSFSLTCWHRSQESILKGGIYKSSLYLSLHPYIYLSTCISSLLLKLLQTVTSNHLHSHRFLCTYLASSISLICTRVLSLPKCAWSCTLAMILCLSCVSITASLLPAVAASFSSL